MSSEQAILDAVHEQGGKIDALRDTVVDLDKRVAVMQTRCDGELSKNNDLAREVWGNGKMGLKMRVAWLTVVGTGLVALAGWHIRGLITGGN